MTALVTRVAVDPKELTHHVSVAVSPDDLVRLRGVLVRILNADLLNGVTSAAVSGQAFMLFSEDDDPARLSQAVVVSSGNDVAVPITSFLVDESRLVLKDDFDDVLFNVSAQKDDYDDDSGPLRVLVTSGSDGDDDGDGDAFELNAADARVYKDVLARTKPSAADCIATIRRPRTSARCLSVEHQRYQLPSWYGDVFVAFLSRALRLHVLARAALADAPPVPLSLLDGGRVGRVGGEGAASLQRCTFQFHGASIGCICQLNKGGEAAGDFKCVQITMQTCGERCAAGRSGCERHRHALQATSPLAARACLGEAKLILRCMHSEEGAVKALSTKELPAKDPFFGALSAAAVELVEINNPVAPDRVKDALCAAFRSEVASRSGRVSEEELAHRDEIALALLAENRHFFGTLGGRGKALALRLRDNPAATVPSHLRNAMATHGHLLAHC